MFDQSSFAEALHSSGPIEGLAEKLSLYGRFVGAWTFEASRHLEDGTVLTGRGEVHFGWVLGRPGDPGRVDPARAGRRSIAILGHMDFLRHDAARL